MTREHGTRELLNLMVSGKQKAGVDPGERERIVPRGTHHALFLPAKSYLRVAHSTGTTEKG